MSSAFILCVEPGRLESQAILLCRSIRRFAGAFADSPIHAFSPRKGISVSKETKQSLSQLGVELHETTLNQDFAHYPIGNKIFSCAYAEENLSQDILVFLDSDSIIVDEPEAVNLQDHIDASVRPVDRKNRGSTGVNDRNEPYWLKMYSILGIEPGPIVKTVVDEEPIRAYFNAGLIIARRRANVFSTWKEDFLALMQQQHLPKNGILNNMDQLSLAGTLSRNFERVEILDWRYNYPLGKRPILPLSLGKKQFEDLVHIHYHRWFHHPRFLKTTRPAINPNGEIAQWLQPFLPLQPAIDGPIRYVETPVD